MREERDMWRRKTAANWLLLACEGGSSMINEQQILLALPKVAYFIALDGLLVLRMCSIPVAQSIIITGVCVRKMAVVGAFVSCVIHLMHNIA